jgi:hypothetical protein
VVLDVLRRAFPSFASFKNRLAERLDSQATQLTVKFLPCVNQLLEEDTRMVFSQNLQNIEHFTMDFVTNSLPYLKDLESIRKALMTYQYKDESEVIQDIDFLIASVMGQFTYGQEMHSYVNYLYQVFHTALGELGATKKMRTAYSVSASWVNPPTLELEYKNFPLEKKQEIKERMKLGSMRSELRTLKKEMEELGKLVQAKSIAKPVPVIPAPVVLPTPVPIPPPVTKPPPVRRTSSKATKQASGDPPPPKRKYEFKNEETRMSRRRKRTKTTDSVTSSSGGSSMSQDSSVSPPAPVVRKGPNTFKGDRPPSQMEAQARLERSMSNASSVTDSATKTRKPRAFTLDQKRELSFQIMALNDTPDMPGLLQVIERFHPLHHDGSEVLEIDVEAYSTETLTEMKKYIKQCDMRKKRLEKQKQQQQQAPNKHYYV